MEKIFELEQRLLNSGKAMTAAVVLALVWVLIMAAGFFLMIRFS